jgi:sulfur-carrier protein
VTVKFFADVRRLAGCEAERFSGAAPTLGALLHALADRHGAAFEQRVFDASGRLSDTLIVLVNGRNVEHLAGEGTALAPDDVVSVFPMVAGG